LAASDETVVLSCVGRRGASDLAARPPFHLGHAAEISTLPGWTSDQREPARLPGNGRGAGRNMIVGMITGQYGVRLMVRAFPTRPYRRPRRFLWPPEPKASLNRRGSWRPNDYRPPGYSRALSQPFAASPAGVRSCNFTTTRFRTARHPGSPEEDRALVPLSTETDLSI
jgi:hypothetical protein